VPVQGQAVRGAEEHQDRHRKEGATERTGRIRIKDPHTVEDADEQRANGKTGASGQLNQRRGH
jgi:hypothetical protein